MILIRVPTNLGLDREVRQESLLESLTVPNRPKRGKIFIYASPYGSKLSAESVVTTLTISTSHNPIEVSSLLSQRLCLQVLKCLFIVEYSWRSSFIKVFQLIIIGQQ